jgi:hypothetical protein
VDKIWLKIPVPGPAVITNFKGDLIMKNTFLRISLMLLPSVCLANSPKDMLSSTNNSASAQVIVAQSVSGELTYLVQGPDGKMRQVSMGFFTDNLEKAIKEAKKVVCDMNVLPQSVTISSVVVSVTYDTKQFCPK